MNTLKAFIYGLFTVALLSSVTALAGDNDGEARDHKAGKHEHMLKRMAKKLDLTEAQQQEIRAIKDSAKASMQDTHEALKASHKEIRAAVKAGAGESEVEQLLIAQAGHKAKMLVERARVHQEVQAVLTEEQREKMSEMRERKKGKMKKHFRDKRAELSSL